MKKHNVFGMAALALVIAVPLIACGGKSVEQLTKESLKLEEQLEQLDISKPADAAKMAKLAAQTLKLAAELEKAEAKAANASTGSGKARPASEFQYDLTADGNGILIKSFTGAGGNVVVPEKIEDIPVVEIGDYALAGDSITGITLPATVKKIGGDAFAYTAITKFVMPDSVTEIGESLFSNCEALAEVHLSDSIEEIVPRFASPLFGFTNKSLKKINLPKNLKRIGEQVFSGLGELSELVIPPELTSIEFGGTDDQGNWTTKTDFSGADNAFYRCGKLPIKTRQTIQGWGYKGSF